MAAADGSTSVLHMGAAYALLAVMWASFLYFVVTWWVTPLHWYMDVQMKIPMTEYLDMNEGYWVLYAAPMLVVTFCAYLYLKLDRSKFPNRSLPLGKFPARFARQVVFANRAVGPVSVGEAFWVLTTAALFGWYFSRSVWQHFQYIDRGESWLAGVVNAKHKWQLQFDFVVERFGWLCAMMMFALFFPVSRGSPILRLTGIPFEQAIRYHRWMGHSVLWMALIHSVGYWVLWIIEGVFWKQIWRWQGEHLINNLAGEIDTIVGIVIWITSLGPVRRRSFETFIWTHQLYLIFLLFLFMHAGPFYLVPLFPALLLHGLDRVLRSVQALHLAQAEEASILADGCVELVIPVAEDLVYKPLDSIFINVPAVSAVQWHAFSITSSPLDGRRRLSVVVKPLGRWTRALEQLVAKQDPVLLRLEGPYGQQQDFYAKYDALVLIAGGSGITPFLAMLKDLLHRCQQNQQKLPSSVTVVWAVRSASSAALLADVRGPALALAPAPRLALRSAVYVTRDSAVEAGGDHAPSQKRTTVRWDSSWPMVAQIGAGKELLSLLIYVFVGGGTFSICLLFTWKWNNSVNDNWASGALALLALSIGIIISSLIVVAIWYLVTGLSTKKGEGENKAKKWDGDGEDELSLTPFNAPEITYGSRPNFGEIFADLRRRMPEADVGVLVSGPEGMEVDVARECRRHSPAPLSLAFSRRRPAFNFHSLSFHL